MSQPYQRRVLDEKQDLDLRIARLTAFVSADSFASLPLQERAAMLRQLDAMLLYSHALGDRIVLWGSPLATPPEAGA